MIIRELIIATALTLIGCAASTHREPRATHKPSITPIEVNYDEFQNKTEVFLQPTKVVSHGHRPEDQLFVGAYAEFPGREPVSKDVNLFLVFWGTKRIGSGEYYSYFYLNRSLILLIDGERVVRGQDLDASTWNNEMLQNAMISVDKAAIPIELEDIRRLVSAGTAKGQVGTQFEFSLGTTQRDGLARMLKILDSQQDDGSK